jgi:hypothetical protein
LRSRTAPLRETTTLFAAVAISLRGEPLHLSRGHAPHLAAQFVAPGAGGQRLEGHQRALHGNGMGRLGEADSRTRGPFAARR